MREDQSNPYAAPLTPLDSSAAADRALSGRWLWSWVLVFGVNLIFPWMIGFGQTRGAGRLGMAVGIVAMLALSVHCLGRYHQLRSPLMVGGICVGLSQFVPILQVVAGLSALGIHQSLLDWQPGPGDDGPPAITTFHGGLLVTVVTGGLLLLAAVAAGKILLSLQKTLKKGWIWR